MARKRKMEIICHSMLALTHVVVAVLYILLVLAVKEESVAVPNPAGAPAEHSELNGEPPAAAERL